jgi:hypothetical protein
VGGRRSGRARVGCAAALLGRKERDRWRAGIMGTKVRNNVISFLKLGRDALFT